MSISSPLKAVPGSYPPPLERTRAEHRGPAASPGSVAGNHDRPETARALVGDTAAMQDLAERVARIARSDGTVLVEGETGTGKELVARAIHARSRRRERPFVAVNCAELTYETAASRLFGHRRGSFTGAIDDHRGFFEAAEHGTIFLDEVGELPLPIQAKLLRVLQEGEIVRFGDSHPRRVDVRVVAATNRRLSDEVAAGRLRADLMYRLAVLPIYVSPLRERRDDVPLLARHFLEIHARKLRLPVPAVSPEAMARLVAYEFPGNVRELEHLVLRAIVLGEPGATIEHDDLVQVMGDPWRAPVRAVDEVREPGPIPDLATAVARYEQELIERALAASQGNRSQAARALGISRRWLIAKLKDYGIGSTRVTSIAS